VKDRTVFHVGERCLSEERSSEQTNRVQVSTVPLLCNCCHSGESGVLDVIDKSKHFNCVFVFDRKRHCHGCVDTSQLRVMKTSWFTNNYLTHTYSETNYLLWPVDSVCVCVCVCAERLSCVKGTVARVHWMPCDTVTVTLSLTENDSCDVTYDCRAGRVDSVRGRRLSVTDNAGRRGRIAVGMCGIEILFRFVFCSDIVVIYYLCNTWVHK